MFEFDCMWKNDQEPIQLQSKLFIKTGAHYEVVALYEVELITATPSASWVWTASKSVRVEKSLEVLLEMLPPNEFYRIDGVTICRISLIEALVTDSQGHYYVEYASQQHPILTISRRRYYDLRRALQSGL